jgi:hypothetical protein
MTLRDGRPEQMLRMRGEEPKDARTTTLAAETCTETNCVQSLPVDVFGSEPVRHCLHDEAKEVRPDARRRPGKTGGVFAGIR